MGEQIGACQMKVLSRAVFSVCVFAAFLSNASISDRVIQFAGTGPDFYADGSAVVDGECYALVWSAAGSAFAGFNADGSLVSPDVNKLVYVAPLAKNGRCRNTLFQIPVEDCPAYEGGEWSVCLLDTRKASGTPAGLSENGTLRRINRWGVSATNLKVSEAASASPVSFRSGRSLSATDIGTTAATRSLLPTGAPTPSIVDFRIENGEAVLKVEGTVSYLTYDLETGETPALGTDNAAKTREDGLASGRITLKADAGKKCGFFRVVRAD
ncbi:MAG: hypothetical protein J6Z49_07520 [Kiritimatiellae bacterium]|nr:hypothetical protein [Kiritimatiellia bacterium]